MTDPTPSDRHHPIEGNHHVATRHREFIVWEVFRKDAPDTCVEVCFTRSGARRAVQRHDAKRQPTLF